jgi:DNA-directed RNA polymerase subunit omega
MAAKRAADIDRGSQPSLPRENDKPAIIALREIAAETISLDGLRELAKRSMVEDDDGEAQLSENVEDISESEQAEDMLDQEDQEDSEGLDDDVEIDPSELRGLTDSGLDSGDFDSESEDPLD